jgi:glycosyltransferase involved in cell wall biosynthesis
MRAALIVSPHFPPSTLAGVHRARHLAKHLPAHGWRPIVLRVDERYYSETNDPALNALVCADLRQVRTGAFPAQLMRRFGVGDIGLRAWPHLARALDRTIIAEHPDVVLITGSPFYPQLLASRARRLGVPVVLDFQDPWVSAHGARAKPGSKAWLAHRLAVALEPLAVRPASFITSVSDLQNHDMATRYRWLDRDRMAAIPIGGDPEDFSALRRQPVGTGNRLDRTLTNFSYVGTFLPRAAPLVERLFSALAHLRRDAPRLAARLRFNFVGTSNQPAGEGGHRVLPIAKAARVADLVRETPHRVPYLEALSLLANSDALLLIGSDEPHYTASKIYPALMSGRPWLSLFHSASSAHAILTAAGGGIAVGFTDEPGLEATVPRLAEALRTLATAPQSLGDALTQAIAPYTAQAIAGRFAAVFNDLVGAAR